MYCNTCSGPSVLTAICALQVRGKSGVYLTFARSYCCCQAYYYEVVSKTEALYVSTLQTHAVMFACHKVAALAPA